MKFRNRWSPMSHAHCQNPLCLVCITAEANMPAFRAAVYEERRGVVGPHDCDQPARALKPGDWNGGVYEFHAVTPPVAPRKAMALVQAQRDEERSA